MGLAPISNMVSTTDNHENEEVITSSPFFIPIANKETKSESVPDDVPTAYFVSDIFEIFYSNFLTSLPRIKLVLYKVFIILVFICLLYFLYWRSMSKKFTLLVCIYF